MQREETGAILKHFCLLHPWGKLHLISLINDKSVYSLNGLFYIEGGVPHTQSDTHIYGKRFDCGSNASTSHPPGSFLIPREVIRLWGRKLLLPHTDDGSDNIRNAFSLTRLWSSWSSLVIRHQGEARKSATPRDYTDPRGEKKEQNRKNNSTKFKLWHLRLI